MRSSSGSGSGSGGVVVVAVVAVVAAASAAVVVAVVFVVVVTVLVLVVVVVVVVVVPVAALVVVVGLVVIVIAATRVVVVLLVALSALESSFRCEAIHALTALRWQLAQSLLLLDGVSNREPCGCARIPVLRGIYRSLPGATRVAMQRAGDKLILKVRPQYFEDIKNGRKTCEGLWWQRSGCSEGHA